MENFGLSDNDIELTKKLLLYIDKFKVDNTIPISEGNNSLYEGFPENKSSITVLIETFEKPEYFNLLEINGEYKSRVRLNINGKKAIDFLKANKNKSIIDFFRKQERELNPKKLNNWQLLGIISGIAIGIISILINIFEFKIKPNTQIDKVQNRDKETNFRKSDTIIVPNINIRITPKKQSIKPKIDSIKQDTKPLSDSIQIFTDKMTKIR